MIQDGMTIVSASVTIYDSGAEQTRGVKGLLDALQDVAKSRATRDLYRFREDNKIGCVMRVPLINDECLVEAGALGRVMRKALREAIGAAKAGDRLVVDFRVRPDSRLHVEVRPADEGGLDASVFEQFQQP